MAFRRHYVTFDPVFRFGALNSKTEYTAIIFKIFLNMCCDFFEAIISTSITIHIMVCSLDAYVPKTPHVSISVIKSIPVII